MPSRGCCIDLWLQRNLVFGKHRKDWLMATGFQDIYDVCKVSERIFVLHPKFRRANFYSQQLRALSLVEGLKENGHLEVGNRSYAVIGRGIAGLTTSAALATLGANVTCVDRAGGTMETYRNVIHRELHPNIIFWPFQPLRPMTNLPFLNWSCNSAAVVRSQILEQWDETFAPIVESVDEEVEQLSERATGVALRFTSGTELNCDVVIVTRWFHQRTTEFGKKSEALLEFLRLRHRYRGQHRGLG